MLSHQEWISKIVQCQGCTLRYAVKWVVCNVERNVYLVRQTLVQTTEQGATTGKVDTVLYDVSVQFRWCVLACAYDGILDLDD